MHTGVRQVLQCESGKCVCACACARARQVGLSTFSGQPGRVSCEAGSGSGGANPRGEPRAPRALLRPPRRAGWRAGCGLAGTGAALPPLARRLRRLLPPQSLWLHARRRQLPFPPLGKKTARGPLSRSNHGLGPKRLGQLPRRRSARVPGQAGHHGPGPAAEVRRHVLQRGGRLREQDAGFRCPERGAAGRQDSPKQPGQRPRLGEPTRAGGGPPAQGPRPGGEQGARARVARARRGGDPERHRQGGFAEPRSQGQGKGGLGLFAALVLCSARAPWPGTTFLCSLCTGLGDREEEKGMLL